MDYLSIHNEALAIAKEDRLIEAKLISILQLVNREQVYKKMGYGSLFTYAVEALNIAPERVYQLNAVAKKCEEVPELKKAIESGELNVSRARRIVSVIDEKTSEVWIEKAVNLPQRDLEKEVARANPKETVPEMTKILNAMEAYIGLSISLKAKAHLERLQDLLSQKTGKPASLRDVIEHFAEESVNRLDPVKKAERNVGKSPKAVNLSSRIKRRPLPASMKHKIFLRDQGQCTKVVQGKRCAARRWLDVHHVTPLAKGGRDTLENLVTLCSAHHRIDHAPNVHVPARLSARPERVLVE